MAALVALKIAFHQGVNRLAMVGFGPREPPFDKYPAPPIRSDTTCLLPSIYIYIWSRPPAGYPPPPPHGMVQVGVQGQGRGMPLLPHH